MKDFIYKVVILTMKESPLLKDHGAWHKSLPTSNWRLWVVRWVSGYFLLSPHSALQQGEVPICLPLSPIQYFNIFGFLKSSYFTPALMENCEFNVRVRQSSILGHSLCHLIITPPHPSFTFLHDVPHTSISMCLKRCPLLFYSNQCLREHRLFFDPALKPFLRV